MALFQCTFFSESLYSSTNVNVILPAAYEGYKLSDKAIDKKFPVLYLLHGFSADCSDWLRGSGIERYATEKGIAVVMPSAGNSFYKNLSNGANYYDYITYELPLLMQTMFNISGKREDNFIAGLSMGGYGAFKIALSKPLQYAAAASLSGAVGNLKQLFNIVSDKSELKLPKTTPVQSYLNFTFGNNFDDYINEQDDVPTLLEKAAKGKDIPLLYQCIGTEDFLYEMNKSFKTLAESLDISFKYEEGAGAHDFNFWDLYIKKVVNWLPVQL